jgi:AcrR family transcriptional regulator
MARYDRQSASGIKAFEMSGIGRRTTAKEPSARAYHHGDLRKALLVAAEAELTEKGVEEFTLRGCAKRAGVSHAAPAHHFRDAGALLTALAAEGFTRFIAAMRKRQVKENGARGRLIAAGLGYVDFALANPALFRLMFSSARPDFSDPALSEIGFSSFKVLTDAVQEIAGADPFVDRAAMVDVAAAWSVVHGLAELLLSGQLPLSAAAADNPDAIFAEIIGRVLPPQKQAGR